MKEMGLPCHHILPEIVVASSDGVLSFELRSYRSFSLFPFLILLTLGFCAFFKKRSMSRLANSDGPNETII